jgi:hypothetical protein
MASEVSASLPPANQLLPPTQISIADKDAFTSFLASTPPTTLQILCAQTLRDAYSTETMDIQLKKYPDGIGESIKLLTDPAVVELDIRFALTQMGLDALALCVWGPTITSLTLACEYADHVPSVSFADVKFLSLEKLEIACQGMSDIVFSKEGFPKLRSIDIDQPGVRRE